MHTSDDQGDTAHRRPDRRHHDRRRAIEQLRGSQSDEAPVTQQSAESVVAFIYVRVSTREQARTGGGEEGYSIPAQRTACIEKARQLGTVVGGIYIDAGESAKTAHRPELQRMLRDALEQRPRYVIVHKIDRLARNRMDDMTINVALRKAGSELVSCTENISDTPSGKFLYNIMADMAQFYSDNLAQEVLKGMRGMVAEGGTPTRAPLGYLHTREYVDGVLASRVATDADRTPLIRWAFEQYATGEWTVEALAQALRDKGLTSRGGPKSPPREITFATLNKILSNPYYLGLVTFQGVTYDGRHKALIDTATWLRVQDVLAIRAHRGEKERKHPHYLRGSIYCGTCGERLVYTQHNGRGGRYKYYGCIKKRLGSKNCPSKIIRLEKIEDGIADLYRGIELPEDEVQTLRLAVRGELAGQAADAHEHAERANRQLSQLTDERAKLLRAHYEGAVPVDLLKTEMDRLTRAMSAAEREATAAGVEIADVEIVLEQALAVAASCGQHYIAAPAFVRRQMNQGFFHKLWIGQDGSVEKTEMTEPFRALLGQRIGSVNEQPHHPVSGGGVMGSQNYVMVGDTYHNTNRSILVTAPEIMLRPVGTRRMPVAVGGAQ